MFLCLICLARLLYHSVKCISTNFLYFLTQLSSKIRQNVSFDTQGRSLLLPKECMDIELNLNSNYALEIKFRLSFKIVLLCDKRTKTAGGFRFPPDPLKRHREA